MTRELFEISLALQDVVDEVLIAAALEDPVGWRGRKSLQPGVLDLVDAELKKLHALRQRLEPRLRPYAQGPKAFLKYQL